MNLKLEFSWRAMFIGAYVTPERDKLWICPFPFVCFYIRLRKESEHERALRIYLQRALTSEADYRRALELAREYHKNHERYLSADPEWANKDFWLLYEHLKEDTHFDAELVKAMLTFAKQAALEHHVKVESHDC